MQISGKFTWTNCSSWAVRSLNILREFWTLKKNDVGIILYVFPYIKCQTNLFSGSRILPAGGVVSRSGVYWSVASDS